MLFCGEFAEGFFQIGIAYLHIQEATFGRQSDQALALATVQFANALLRGIDFLLFGLEQLGEIDGAWRFVWQSDLRLGGGRESLERTCRVDNRPAGITILRYAKGAIYIGVANGHHDPSKPFRIDMAIEFARSNVISRSKGHSAVKAAAYRSGTELMDEQIGQLANYRHRADEVAHSEILLPAGGPASLLDRQTLWAAIEVAENKSTRRASAQLAIDHIIALPRELSLQNQVAMAREFALVEFVAHGVGVDLNIHLHSKRNPHAHLLTTTRLIDGQGIGLKARALNGRFAAGRKLVDAHQLRHRWAAFQNDWGRRNGVDLLVTNNNGEWAAEMHRGPHRSAGSAGPTTKLPSPGTNENSRVSPTSADQIRPERHELDHQAQLLTGKARLYPSERLESPPADFNERVRNRRETDLAVDPTEAIRRVARMKAVFSRHDIYRELARHISNRDAFAAAKARVDASAILVSLTDPGPLGEWFTTTEVLETEQRIAHACQVMAGTVGGVRVNSRALDRLVEKRFAYLSQEQQQALHYVTGGRRLAGSGKSSALGAANEAWLAAGASVTGLALAGKAAQSLEGASGIPSRTIHSFLYAHQIGRRTVSAKDVFVLDEAGMVNAELMLRLLAIVEPAGATLIVVGDPDQLQPIQAGNPFRSIARNQGFLELATIRRQRQDWARRATYHFARHQTREALEILHKHRCFRKTPDRDSAVLRIASDYVNAFRQGNLATQSIVLAHANQDVWVLNARIRELLVGQGVVEAGFPVRVAGDRNIEFGKGDRLLFKRNDLALGVRNGSLGTVVATAPGLLTVQLDEGRRVAVDVLRYNNVDLGYAMTVHKAQGVTVDRVRVLITPLWDRHLSYVALSRHREQLEIYFGDNEFRGTDPVTRQPRSGLTDVMSRDSSKMSATDFAEQHGLEIQGVRAVELPDAELRRRAGQAQEMISELFEARISVSESDLAKRVTPIQNQLLEASKAFEESRRRQPHGWLAAFLRQRWAKEHHRLNQTVVSLEKQLLGLEHLERESQSDRVAARREASAEIARRFPRQTEIIQAWEDRKVANRATNSAGQSQGRVSGPRR